jgi:putative ABC transport system permease protein
VPVQTVLLVRGTWVGRKVPANRSDRVDLERRARVRRIAVELTVVALAVAAFVSIATRGLLETQTDGVDLLLASAPLLLAATITIIVLRVYRLPLTLGIAAGRRSIGALGLLAAVRAQRSIAVLPLLALTLAVALAVGGGLLASTVSAGRHRGSAPARMCEFALRRPQRRCPRSRLRPAFLVLPPSVRKLASSSGSRAAPISPTWSP